MKYVRQFQVVVSLLILLITFQNCTPSSLSNFVASDLASLKSYGGNGEPYDGKPVYTHLVPGLTCADHQAAVGRIEIQGTEAHIIDAANACQNGSSTVPVSALEASSFSNLYLGYGGAVYTLTANQQENIAQGVFTEAWCRAWNSAKTQSVTEVAVEWRELGKTAKLTVFKEQGAGETPLVSMRTLDVDRVSYAQADGSQLKINLKQKIPGTQKVAGTFSGMVSGKEVSTAVECLMGGQFDPIAPQFSFPGTTNKTLAVGETVQDLTPIVNKETVQFELGGDLPKGLQFNSKTGAITGAPETQRERQKFPITAVFSIGRISRIVSIGVGAVQAVDQASVSSSSAACSNADRDCDLSGAIERARQMAPLPLIIHLKTPSLNLSGAELPVQGDVTIIGDATTPVKIDARSLSRHFAVGAGSYLGIQNLDLLGGNALLGGSLHAEQATLVIENSVFENNLSGTTMEGSRGGAIYAKQSFLDIRNSFFRNNQSFLNGSLIGGGAIYIESATASFIKDSTFSNNSAQQGGALSSGGSGNPILEISNSKFDSNSAMMGGAIYSILNDLSISHSQFSNNNSIFEGGAIAFQVTDRAWLTDSTFDGNKGGGTGSAAIYWEGRLPAEGFGEGSLLYILESKFTRHTSRTPSAAVIMNRFGEIIFRGTSLLQNSPLHNCQAPFDASVTKMTSLGGNTSDDGSCPE